MRELHVRGAQRVGACRARGAQPLAQWRVVEQAFEDSTQLRLIAHQEAGLRGHDLPRAPEIHRYHWKASVQRLHEGDSERFG